MLEAGFSKHQPANPILAKITSLIAEEREVAAREVTISTTTASMEMAEALREIGVLARTSPDEKIKLQALRTVLEVHGALSKTREMPDDRRKLMREIEAMLDRIRTRTGTGSTATTATTIPGTISTTVKRIN